MSVSIQALPPPSPPHNRSTLNVNTSSGTPRENIDWSKVDPKIADAAQGMEAMFLEQMFKVMRETIPKNDMDLESPATEIYRSLLDGEVAKNSAKGGGVGLAEQIVAYLDGQRYNQKAGKDAPHGGHHEGQPIK